MDTETEHHKFLQEGFTDYLGTKTVLHLNNRWVEIMVSGDISKNIHKKVDVRYSSRNYQ